MSDIRRNIEKLQPALHFVHWNQQGWKTGLCSVPPIGQVSSFVKVHARCSVPPVEEVYLFVCLVGWFVYLFLFVCLFCFVCDLEYMPGALCRLFVLFVCLFLFCFVCDLEYMPGALCHLFVLFVFVCFCLFVCLFVLFCFVCVLEYMPGALCHLFVLFCLSMFCLCFHKVHMHICIHPWMTGCVFCFLF